MTERTKKALREAYGNAGIVFIPCAFFAIRAYINNDIDMASMIAVMTVFISFLIFLITFIKKQ